MAKITSSCRLASFNSWVFGMNMFTLQKARKHWKPKLKTRGDGPWGGRQGLVHGQNKALSFTRSFASFQWRPFGGDPNGSERGGVWVSSTSPPVGLHCTNPPFLGCVGPGLVTNPTLSSSHLHSYLISFLLPLPAPPYSYSPCVESSTAILSSRFSPTASIKYFF